MHFLVTEFMGRLALHAWKVCWPMLREYPPDHMNSYPCVKIMGYVRQKQETGPLSRCRLRRGTNSIFGCIL
jgi:hypothetical protein